MSAIFKNLCEAKFAELFIIKTVHILPSAFHLFNILGKKYLIIQLVLTPAHQPFGFHCEAHSYP